MLLQRQEGVKELFLIAPCHKQDVTTAPSIIDA
jgi:hypothetical protein